MILQRFCLVLQKHESMQKHESSFHCKSNEIRIKNKFFISQLFTILPLLLISQHLLEHLSRHCQEYLCDFSVLVKLLAGLVIRFLASLSPQSILQLIGQKHSQNTKVMLKVVYNVTIAKREKQKIEVVINCTYSELITVL